LKFSQTDVNAPHPSTYPERTQCPTKELPSLGPDQGQPCHPLAPWARATHNLEEDGKRERERRVKRTRTGRKTDKSIEGEREWMKNGKGTESEDDGGIKQGKMETCR